VKYLARLLILLALFFGGVVCLSAQTAEANPYETSLQTEAGVIQISQRKDVDYGYEVRLGGRVILKTNADGESDPYGGNFIPKIHTYFKRGLDDGKELVLLEFISGGNACPAGSLQFLVLGRDELPTLSNLVDACIPPVVTFDYNKVTLFFPRSPVIRGSGFIPAETWVYQNGTVRKRSAAQGRGRK
jgi:hypothetical protein